MDFLPLAISFLFGVVGMVAADFARTNSGVWVFVEAGPGSCAGTAHEAVFKAVARRLRGEEPGRVTDAVGGTL